MFSWQRLIVSVIGGMVGAMVIQWCVGSHPPRFATVDITRMIDAFVKSTAHQSLSVEATHQKIKLFSRQLQQTLQQMAQQQHFLILPQEAVIAGSVDITEQVKARLHKRMTL